MNVHGCATFFKNFNLPWHQHDDYLDRPVSERGAFFHSPSRLASNRRGLRKNSDDGMSVRTGNNWKTLWDQIYSGRVGNALMPTPEVMVSLVSRYGRPDPESGFPECKTPMDIQLLAESLWLGQALIEGRVMCYLQPVIDRNDKIFGYESFARAKAKDGAIIGGDQIIAASKVLGIEYMIDRMLHVEAIKTFVTSEL